MLFGLPLFQWKAGNYEPSRPLRLCGEPDSLWDDWVDCLLQFFAGWHNVDCPNKKLILKAAS